MIKDYQEYLCTCKECWPISKAYYSSLLLGYKNRLKDPRETMAYKNGDKVKIGMVRNGFGSYVGPYTGEVGTIIEEAQGDPCLAYYVNVNGTRIMCFANELKMLVTNVD
jgi:hypothetical protein